MTRKVKRLEGEDWVDIEFMDLKEGDLFKLFDDRSDSFKENGKILWRATGAPYISKRYGKEVIQSEIVKSYF